MFCSAVVSKVHPGLSIPDLIKLIRYTFRQCEFDEVQNTLMEREKKMKLEIEEYVRDRDSLKKEIDLLEKSQSVMELQKCDAEKKLEMSKKRCDESDKVIARMEEEIRVLKNEKLVVEENLECSNRKCEEMDGRLLKMGAKQKRCKDLDKEIVHMGKTIRILNDEKMVVEEKLQRSDRKCEEMLREIEDLRREKLDANRTIAELKQKEIEANQTVQELKLKNGEASQTIDELRSKIADLDESILRIENGLTKMLSVDTEDLPNLVKGMDACADSKEEENGDDVLPEVRATCDNSAGSVGAGLSQKGGIIMAHPRTVPAVAESCGTVKDNEFQEPGVKGPTGKTQPAGIVIVLSDSDDEEDAVDTIPGKSSGRTSKRNRTECREDSPITSTTKRGRSTFAQPLRCSLFPSRLGERAAGAACDSEYPPLSSRTVNYEDCVDSDADSDTHMNDYVSTTFKK